ncbi:hypothetical protein GCM10007856_22520 [Azospirillum oryzae]|nr:hypothetical protein GCM10007856_22520 [Azospirillum oryzae]
MPLYLECGCGRSNRFLRFYARGSGRAYACGPKTPLHKDGGACYTLRPHKGCARRACLFVALVQHGSLGRVTVNVQVLVRDNNVDQALRALKKKMQREGIFREMKLRRNYEKPSEKRAREKAEAVRRTRKLLRKRMEREGY